MLVQLLTGVLYSVKLCMVYAFNTVREAEKALQMIYSPLKQSREVDKVL